MEDLTIYLGNRAAIKVVGDERQEVPGKRVTIIKPAPGLTFQELAHDLTHPNGIWASHSDADRPVWVACTDQTLGARLAAFFDCEHREVEVS